MMRSLFSGVAGLKTHQTRMDVIGNNIANVNTTAYKSQSMTFQDLLYQTTQNASAANANTGAGGINARQIGLGAKTGAISTAITQQGSAQSTNNPFDIMITGDSFFVVSNGSDNFFTRDGAFCVDGVGNLVMSSTGYTVMGWQSDADGNVIQDKVSPLRIMSAENMTYPPEATSLAYVSGIVDKNDVNVTSSTGKVIGLSFYDNLGYQYNARFSIHELFNDAGEAVGDFYIQLDKILNSEGEEVTGLNPTFGGDVAYTNKDKLTALASGYSIQAVTTEGVTTYKLYNGDNEVTTTADSAELAAAFKITLDDNGKSDKYDSWTFNESDGSLTVSKSGTASNAAYLHFDKDTGLFKGISATADATTADDATMVLDFPATDANFSDITIDFTNTTMYNNNGTSTVAATNGNTAGLGTGRRLGELSGVSVSKDGIITGTYDNGQSKILGQIAVAAFANAAGLEKAGDNLYTSTPNSGEFDGIGIDITANGDYMTSGVLEMSNVDLANEFTTMITTQRGFQANSRIITVSDTLLEELTNLKR
ncbi:MAG: flagellar hook-basal body complex protein [Lachnospiraceae bacterium]|nr:flagellar hook-basal body complex protein [Lachnospiraceae bacterium]